MTIHIMACYVLLLVSKITESQLGIRQTLRNTYSIMFQLFNEYLMIYCIKCFWYDRSINRNRVFDDFLDYCHIFGYCVQFYIFYIDVKLSCHNVHISSSLLRNAFNGMIQVVKSHIRYIALVFSAASRFLACGLRGMNISEGMCWQHFSGEL